MNVCRLSRGIRLCVRVVCVDARVRVSLALSKGHVCILHKCGTKYFPLLHHPGDQQIKKNVLSHHRDLVTFFFFFPASALGTQSHPATGAVLLLSV